MLEAFYISVARESVDAESVLLYNGGRGRFAATAREGLRFERVFAEPPGSPAIAHLHRYAIVPLDSDSHHWRRGGLLGAVARGGRRRPPGTRRARPVGGPVQTRRKAQPPRVHRGGSASRRDSGLAG